MVIEDADINSKDAFWNTENVTVINSRLTGEYLGWHSKNLRLVNCHISGTQPLSYCDNLIMENCTMDVDAVKVMVFAMVLATAAGTTMGCVVEDKDSMTAWHARRRACHGNPLVLR